LHVFGWQILEFQCAMSSQSAYVVAFTVQRYSFPVPFYSLSGSRLTAPQNLYPVPSSSVVFLPAMTGAPYTEFWLRTDRSCRAHILI
jgi:hypothetical protein